MNKKLLVPIIALVALGAAYKFVLAKPKVAEAKPKVEGTVYVLGKDFLLNLADGRYAKMTVALVLSPEDKSTVAAKGESAPKPPDGFGSMGQEAVVRDVITDDITGVQDVQLESRSGRHKLEKEILKDLRKKTDVEVSDVLFSDVTVQ